MAHGMYICSSVTSGHEISWIVLVMASVNLIFVMGDLTGWRLSAGFPVLLEKEKKKKKVMVAGCGYQSLER